MRRVDRTILAIISGAVVAVLLAGSILGFAAPCAVLADSIPPDLSGVPQPCAAAPPSDTLSGSAGSATPCTPRPDATRPTVVQAAIVSTDATGAWSVSWAKAFSSATPYINPQAINVSGSQPYVCNVSASTATTATGKCWQTTTMTLPTLASSLLGLVINPTGTSGVIQVRVAARDATQ